MWVVVLPVGADRYAVEVAGVREVLAWPVVTPLPTAPPAVVGVANVRGEIVPVLDTGALVGAPVDVPATHVVVLDSGMGPAGLSATAVPESARLGDPAGPPEGPAARGRYRVGASVVTLLDVEALLAPARVGGWSP